ncbi:MAG: preprotein translocase subunit SecG [Gammaproteobacteria bacterium]|nr:preprotein translocase subunit SecG [Gammaproteobacteria bacterium]
MIETILIIFLILDAVALGFLILIQQSKGADVGAAFGSGSANTLFGPTGGSSFLVKMTTILAVVFFVLTFGLAYLASERAAELRGYDFVDDTDDTEIPDVGITDAPGDDMPSAAQEGDDLPTLEDEGDGIPDIPLVEDSSDADTSTDEGDGMPEDSNQ